MPHRLYLSIVLFCMSINQLVGMERSSIQRSFSIKNALTEIEVTTLNEVNGCEISKKNVGDAHGYAFMYYFENQQDPLTTVILSSDSRFLFLVQKFHVDIVKMTTKSYQQMFDKKKNKNKIDVNWGIVKDYATYEFPSAIKSIIQDDEPNTITIYEENGMRTVLDL